MEANSVNIAVFVAGFALFIDEPSLTVVGRNPDKPRQVGRLERSPAIVNAFTQKNRVFSRFLSLSTFPSGKNPGKNTIPLHRKHESHPPAAKKRPFQLR